MIKNHYLLAAWRLAVWYTITDLSVEDATSIFFDRGMNVEIPLETSVLINQATEHDIAKTVKLIEKKTG